jgi:hypothetical protein
LKTIRTLGILLTFAGAAGCTTAVAPPELANARTVYDRASHGPTAQLNPTDLHIAKESLDAAEASFDANGDTPDTRDLGYTAQRRTETAEARARTMMAIAQKDTVIAQMHASTASQAQQSSAQLGRANQALATQGAQLQNEVHRRQ